MKRLRQIVDYAAYGGAPLLGVDGVCIIAHGRSDAQAVANAIEVAARFKQRDVNEQIVQRIRLDSEAKSPGAEVK